MEAKKYLLQEICFFIIFDFLDLRNSTDKGTDRLCVSAGGIFTHRGGYKRLGLCVSKPSSGSPTMDWEKGG